MPFVVSLAPITTRILKRLRAKTDVFAGAVEHIELAPAAVSYSPKMICLPNESDRAIGAEPAHSIEAMKALEPDGEHLHRPTVAYRFDNAVLADGCFYSNWRCGFGGPRHRRPVIIATADYFVEAQLSTDWASDIYFGHWLCDGLCTELLAIDRGLPGLVYERPVRLHEAGYRKMLEIPVRAVSVARVERLWVVDDRGINSQRGERFRRLRSRVRRSVSERPAAPPYVFITRNGGGMSRQLVNEAVVVEALAKRGVDVIDPMTMAPKAIAERLAEAKVVIGVEGSHLSHALLAMPEGGAILTIQPPQRLLHHWKIYSDLSEIRYGFVVADPHPDGFTLELDRLQRTFDLLIAAI